MRGKDDVFEKLVEEEEDKKKKKRKKRQKQNKEDDAYHHDTTYHDNAGCLIDGCYLGALGLDGCASFDNASCNDLDGCGSFDGCSLGCLMLPWRLFVILGLMAYGDWPVVAKRSTLTAGTKQDKK